MKGTLYTCQECGMQSPKWLGRCPDCGAWQSFVEEAPAQASTAKGATPAKGHSLGEALNRKVDRISTRMRGMDRLLGGGWVPGSVVLIGGEPGVGKSTLMLQLSAQMADGGEVVYVTGEESTGQVAMRAKRLGVKEGITLMAETTLEPIMAYLEENTPAFVVVDSIQTLMSSELNSAPGSVSQVRAVTSLLSRMAKENHFVLVIVGHVTKEGAIAGPRTLEHMVDVVLYFEGDLEYQYRLLRSHKNRFGSTLELVVYEMTEEGLVEEAIDYDDDWMGYYSNSMNRVVMAKPIPPYICPSDDTGGRVLRIPNTYGYDTPRSRSNVVLNFGKGDPNNPGRGFLWN